MQLRKLVPITTLCLLAVWGEGFAASPYDDDLSDISASLRALMIEAGKVKYHPELEIQIRSKLLVLEKRLHRIDEEAMNANNNLLATSQNGDSGLTTAAAISEALDLTDSQIGHYLDTGNKVFLESANKAAQIARELQTSQ